MARIHGRKPIGPGPGPTEFRKSRTEPDQDQQNLENLGPSRTDRSSDNGGPWIPGHGNKLPTKFEHRGEKSATVNVHFQAP